MHVHPRRDRARRRRAGRPHGGAARATRGSRRSRRTPTPGDALLIGLSNAVPSCAVTLRMECTVAGVGVDPRRPPRVWEAWTGTGWTAVRGRPRRHRRPQQGRRRGAARPRGAPDLDHRPGAGRLAALPAGREPARPADVHRAAAGRTRSRRSRSGARRRWPTPRCCTARPSASPTAPRASGSRCCAGRCWPPSTAGTLEVQTPEGEQIWTEVRQFAESGPERPALPPRPRAPARCSSARRSGSPTGRLRTTAPCRRAARRCC